MPYTHPDCIDNGREFGPCQGETFEAPSVTGATVSVRCEAHRQAYLERMEPMVADVRSRYPDSPTPPSWFDPTYAGESWDED